MITRVDLNCDLGEGFGVWQLGEDERLLDQVSSASIACGMHAGDPGTMRRTVAAAAARGVAVGAHPGLPDLVGMGRRAMSVTAQEAYDLTLYQIGALDAFARAAGVTLQHVKPHGALYTMAARDLALAEALARATKAFRADLVFVGLPGSALQEAAVRAGTRFAGELFADRTYQPDGSLTPRSRGREAFVASPEEAGARVLAALREGFVTAVTGERVAIRAETVCVHGDGGQAVAMLGAVRQALAAAGIAVLPLVQVA